MNRWAIELTEDAGELRFRQGAQAPLPVRQLGVGRFVAEAGAGGPRFEFVLVPATETRPAYLHLGLWAFVHAGRGAQ